MSRYSYWGFTPQPTVWERQQKAAKTIARMRKKGAWDALVKRSSGQT